MPLDANEREALIVLIGAVRTVARQVLPLHLQLAAARSLLAKKGEAELKRP